MKAKTNGTIAVVALAMIASLVFAFCRPASVEAVYPAEKAVRTVSRRTGVLLSGLWNSAKTALENERLRREVASLSMVRADYERLSSDYARLQELLDARRRMEGEWLSAGVLSAGGGAAGTGKTLRVDKGTADGVKVGSVVAVPAGLVGRVISATLHTSVVLLITDPTLMVACEVEAGLGTSSARGILSGGSADLLVLRHMNLTDAAQVSPRARVLTSGLGGVYPRGIPVGTLLSCDTRAGGPSKEGEVQPAVDFVALEDVFIRNEK